MIGMSRFGAPHEHLALAGGQVVVVLDVVRDCRCFVGAEAAAVGEHPANVLQVLMEVLEALARVFPPGDQGLVGTGTSIGLWVAGIGGGVVCCGR